MKVGNDREFAEVVETKGMLAKRLAAAESVARNRATRVHLGELLRVYYASMERAPVPTPLADLIEQLTQRSEENNNKPE